MYTPSNTQFHPNLEDYFDQWARYLGWTPKRLRASVTHALDNRLHNATLAQLCRPHPPIFRLALGKKTKVIFTIEPHAIVVRGFDEPRAINSNEDDDFGIWYFTDWDWSGDVSSSPLRDVGGAA